MKIAALLDALNSALAEPYALAWVSDSPRFLLVFTVIYAVAVIVAVTREDKILLAHNSRFVSGVYGLIAGFVEAGESAEQAIHREIMEETGIEVTDIRYLTSQSWPFPNSLMLGFQAKYKAGEAHADGEELTDLGWFTADTLPSIPQPGSVARKIIDDFLKGNLK